MLPFLFSYFTVDRCLHGRSEGNLMTEVKSSDIEVSKPSILWLATEPHRAIFEYGLSIPYKFWKTRKPSGDGHPVLVLPGFMATDKSTKPLRKFIQCIGYETYGWEIGRNFGKEEYLDILIQKLKDIHAEHNQHVTVIGWSLGGIFARQLAKAHPELVRQVITLGSPFRNVLQSNNASWIHQILRGGKSRPAADEKLLADIPLPAPVPTTALYTKEDGVVPWEYCLEATEDDIHQNIQVRGSHIGLGYNPTVLSIIEDRLELSKSDWTKYETPDIIGGSLLYPSS